MKKLFLIFALLLCVCYRAKASDVQIGATTIPGFYAANLPSDITLNNVNVSFNSPTVTCSSCFRSSWWGLGGFRIKINGVVHTVKYVTSTSSLTLTINYMGSTSSSATVLWYKWVELRVYSDSSFNPLGKSYIVQPGAVGSGAWHRRVASSVVNEFGVNYLYIPEITIDATTDSPTNQAARYSAVFYRPDGSQIQIYDCFESFSLPPITATSWLDICTHNTQALVAQDYSAYTKTQIGAMRTGCSAGQGLYYAETGLKPACLIFGTGLTLTGNTLSSAGNVYSTILNNNSPLTQRSFLHFIGPSFTVADNAGIPSTDVNLDADLNALASSTAIGLWARTGNGTGAARALQGPTSGDVFITNNDGVAGNPIIDLSTNIARLNAAQSWTAKQTYAPSGTTATINLGGVTTDPSSASVGDTYYNSGLSSLMTYNGVRWTPPFATLYSSFGSTPLTFTAVTLYTIPANRMLANNDAFLIKMAGLYSATGSGTRSIRLIATDGTNTRSFGNGSVGMGAGDFGNWIYEGMVIRTSSTQYKMYGYIVITDPAGAGSVAIIPEIVNFPADTINWSAAITLTIAENSSGQGVTLTYAQFSYQPAP